jgi:fibronectin-binding autotransporter adhesin
MCCSIFRKRFACIFGLVGIAFTSSASGQDMFKRANDTQISDVNSWAGTDNPGPFDPPPAFGEFSNLWFGTGMGAARTLGMGSNLTVGSLRVDNTSATSNHGVTLTGANTLTLNGNNQYSGSYLTGIVLAGAEGGSLSVGTGILVKRSQSWVAARNYSITGQVTLDGTTLTLRQSAGTASISGQIVGNGSVVAESANSLISLSGSNNFTGGTTVNQGILQISGSGQLGTGNIVFGGAASNGTFRFGTAAHLNAANQLTFNNTAAAGTGGRLEYVGTGAVTINNQINGGSGNGIRIASDSSGSLTVNGTLNANNKSLYLEGTSTGNNTLASVFNGNGGLLKRDSGTWVLSGNNVYTGGTVIEGGLLRVNALSRIGSGSLTIGGGSTFRYEGAGGAGIETTARTLNLNSGASTIDVTDSSASLTFSSTDGIRNQAFTKAGSGELTIAGGFSGAASITVAGGTLRLTGASDHSGTTTVNNGGALVIDGTHTGGGAYDIQAGSELMGTGTIGANVSVANGATLAAGNSIGTLNMVGNLTIGGAFEWEVNSALNTADLVNVNGNVDLTGAVLNIVQLVDFPENKKFTLLSYSGTLTGTFSGFDTTMWTINYADRTAGLNGGSHANFVTLSAVPEPTAFLFVGATIAVGFLRRRRSI